jgi:hypothetical protein
MSADEPLTVDQARKLGLAIVDEVCEAERTSRYDATG